MRSPPRIPVRPLLPHPTDPTILLVQLSQGAVAQVDNSPLTFEVLAPYNWALGPQRGGPQGMRFVRADKTTVLLHNAILPCPPKHGIYFKNGDKLDCRLSNMEIKPLGDIQRQYNKGKTLGYTCDIRSGTPRYRSQVALHGTMHHLGTFGTPEEARAAYLNFRDTLQ